MHQSKPISTPFKLSITQTPNIEEERRKMDTIPYASGVGSIMYGMVCSRPDLAHVVSIVSKFMVDLGQVHWEASKWLFGSLKPGLKYKKAAQGGDTIRGMLMETMQGIWILGSPYLDMYLLYLGLLFAGKQTYSLW